LDSDAAWHGRQINLTGGQIMRLAHKVAIVTGGARGMGESACLLFAREGARVAVVDINEAGAAVTADRIKAEGGQAIAVGVDLRNSSQVQEMVERTAKELGRPTVLFNNAAIDGGKAPLLQTSDEKINDVIDVNIKGVWLPMKFVIPHMIEAKGGSIVNSASVSAFKAGNSAIYAASKGAVVAMTRVAAVEFGLHNIRVNTLCPGATLTPMTREAAEEMTTRGTAMTPARRAMLSVFGRFAEPEEMANVALFLASDESSFATGMFFMNDGGWSVMSGVDRRFGFDQPVMLAEEMT
jgi:NAD(P)-dependent dehydrogenase (short-subunit alcohol dehydrogenase family)